MSQALGNPSDLSLILSLIVVKRRFVEMLLVSLMAFSCSVQPTKPTEITLIDLKSQNVEKIRAGLESVLGNDSAGTAAMSYVTSYEDQLAKFYPQEKNGINSQQPQDDLSRQLAPLYFLHPPTPSTVSPQEAQERAQLQLFDSFSKEMLRTSKLRLNQCYESCTASGNIGDAKMAFASGYIALTLSPRVGESEKIENTMAALLDSLNARRSTK